MLRLIEGRPHLRTTTDPNSERPERDSKFPRSVTHNGCESGPFEPAAIAERWRWDLNPRRGCPLTRFRGVGPRPLGDPTPGALTRIRACARAGPPRRPPAGPRR